MTRRMLINASHPEETRIAIADDDHLLELEVERTDHTQLKGNIYKSSITRIEPSLQAAFLDIGSTRNGFLQINDIHQAFFQNWPPESSNGRISRPHIQDVLQAKQDLIVQVVKDEREAKGATLTTNLSIPGRYLVLMVGNQRGGVSRKISDEGQRRRLRHAVQGLEIPPGMGVIVRTAGINKSTVELQGDLDALLDLWYKLVEKSFEPGAPTLLYREPDLAIRTIRDYLTSDIDEILIDDEKVYEEARQFVEKALPSFASNVILYAEPQPLFSNYHLDDQVNRTGQPEVVLPSGGSIVINTTEAVVAIDVNSGRSTSQADVENTAFETNKEAGEAIAEQLRLRDLGGLVVIDFIDMVDRRHKQNVEKVLKEAVRVDKAKVEIGRISKFGLLEMSRQRLKSSLVSQSHQVCPHCAGRGQVKTPETAALEALRKTESAVAAGGVKEVRVRMAPAAALFLLNSKRRNISRLETDYNLSILVYADGRLKPEEYELQLDAGKREIKTVLHTVRPVRTEEKEPEGTRSSRRGGQRDSDSKRSGRKNSGRNKRYGKKNDDRRTSGRSSGNRRRPKNDASRSNSRDTSAPSKSVKAERNSSKEVRDDGPKANAPTKKSGESETSLEVTK